MSGKGIVKEVLKKFRPQSAREFQEIVELFIADIGLVAVIDNYEKLRKGWGQVRFADKHKSESKKGGNRLLEDLKARLREQFPADYIKRYGTTTQPRVRARRGKKTNVVANQDEEESKEGDPKSEESDSEEEEDQLMQVSSLLNKGKESQTVVLFKVDKVKADPSVPVEAVPDPSIDASQAEEQVPIGTIPQSLVEAVPVQIQPAVVLQPSIVGVDPVQESFEEQAARVNNDFWALIRRDPRKGVQFFTNLYVDLVQKLKQENSQGLTFMVLSNSHRAKHLHGDVLEGRDFAQQTDPIGDLVSSVPIYPVAAQPLVIPSPSTSEQRKKKQSIVEQTLELEKFIQEDKGDVQKEDTIGQVAQKEETKMEVKKGDPIQQDSEEAEPAFDSLKNAGENTVQGVYYKYQLHLQESMLLQSNSKEMSMGEQRRLRIKSIEKLIEFLRISDARLLKDLKKFFTKVEIEDMVPNKGSKFVEVFCGLGHSLLQVVSAFGCKGTGLENSLLASVMASAFKSAQIEAELRCEAYSGGLMRNHHVLTGRLTGTGCTHILSMDYDQSLESRSEVFRTLEIVRFKVLLTSRNPMEAFNEGLRTALFMRKIEVKCADRTFFLYAYTSMPLSSNEPPKMNGFVHPIHPQRWSNVSECRLLIDYLIYDTSNWVILPWTEFYKKFVEARLQGHGALIPTMDVMKQAASTLGRVLTTHVGFSVQGGREFIQKKKQLTTSFILPKEIQEDA